MVTLIVVKNAFSPQDGREVKHIEAGKTLAELLTENAIDGVELQATVNGYSVDNTTEIHDNDFVVIYPVVAKGDKGGKGILGIIAAIALSVVSFGIAGGGWLAGMGKVFQAGMWGAQLAAAAVMFIGSALIGRFMGQKVDTGNYGGEKDDPSYSWGGVQTMEGQNNSIPLTYGVVKSGGQTISKFVTVDDNDEYLNWLVSAGEGELSISDVRLNDNPYKNYADVSIETRDGTNDQTVIDGFGDTYNSKTVSRKLSGSWVTETVPGGNMIRGIMLEITFPAGLYHVKDSGQRENNTVTFDIEYKIDGGSWTNLFKDISANSAIYTGNNPVATSGCVTLVKNIAAGDYTVKISPYESWLSDDEYGSVDGAYITIGDSKSSAISISDFGSTSVTVGAFKVNTKKLSASTITSVKDGNAVTSTLTVTSGGNGTVTDKTNSALRKQYKINKLPEGEYSIRARVIYRQYPERNDRAASTCELSIVSGIIYDDFKYPCTALIGIIAKATDQLSGSPSLSFMKERRYVWVWNGSEYVQKRANNPAWACYDLLHQARKLKNVNTGNDEFEVRGVPAERMRYADFAAWASWCSSKKLYVNIEINQVGEMLEVANQKIAPIGRGTVVRFGTRYGCIYDHSVQNPVQMFGMGNIVAGTFQEEFLKVADRANCVEVTFTNADADYQRDVLTIYGDTFDSDGYAKTAQLTMDGITDYTQAYREGKYQLMCNKYQLRTVSFEADIDSIACTVGDAVLVSHDVPKWANSGRIEEVNGNEMKLPCYVSDLTQSYRIQYRKQNDNLYTKACTIVSTTEDGWTVISVSDTENMPQAGDVFDLAIANIGSKPFVIKGITRSQEFRRKITCIEYAEALYNEDYDIPPIQYAVPAYNTPKNVTKLSASQYAYTDSYGRKHNIMSVSWEKPSNGGKFTVLYSADKVKWTTAYTQIDSDSVEFEIPKQDWYIKVITTLGVRHSSGVISALIPKGVDVLPPDITQLNVERMASGTRRFWWEFEYPVPNDIAGFRFKHLQSNLPNWKRGIPVQDGLVTSQPFETEMIRQGTCVVMVKAVDNAGQESKNFAYTVLDLGDLLEENVLWTKDFSENGWENVTHNGTVLADGSIVSADNNAMWTENSFRWIAKTEDAWQPQFDELNAEMVFVAPASGQFWIRSDIDGPGIVYYALSHSNTQWEYTNTNRWQSDDAPQWVLYWDMNKQWSDRILLKAGDIVRIKVVGLNDENKRTKINKIEVVIDVPDIVEHFEDITVPATGLQLPLKTPHYYTTAVRLDAIQNSNATTVKYISRTPCIIQLLNNSGTAVAGVADVTWQGYQKEVL